MNTETTSTNYITYKVTDVVKYINIFIAIIKIFTINCQFRAMEDFFRTIPSMKAAQFI